jgi:hypothetical protein
MTDSSRRSASSTDVQDAALLRPDGHVPTAQRLGGADVSAGDSRRDAGGHRHGDLRPGPAARSGPELGEQGRVAVRRQLGVCRRGLRPDQASGHAGLLRPRHRHRVAGGPRPALPRRLPERVVRHGLDWHPAGPARRRPHDGRAAGREPHLLQSRRPLRVAGHPGQGHDPAAGGRGRLRRKPEAHRRAHTSAGRAVRRSVRHAGRCVDSCTRREDAAAAGGQWSHGGVRARVRPHAPRPGDEAARHPHQRRPGRAEPGPAPRARPSGSSAHWPTCSGTAASRSRTSARRSGWSTPSPSSGCRSRAPRRRKQGSFEKEWLERCAHPAAQHIAQARALHDGAEKFLGTYIMEHLDRGRIHAEIHQLRSEEGGTRTRSGSRTPTRRSSR